MSRTVKPSSMKLRYNLVRLVGKKSVVSFPMERFSVDEKISSGMDRGGEVYDVCVVM